MRQNALLTKMICSITAYAFMLAVLPRPVQARGLAPLSFERMYALAQQGNVEALRASVYRGLNIDTVDSHGNTGLCIAALRGDSYTYNAFRAAGANPHHPCVQNVSDYEDFVNSSRAVPINATSRDAYSALGKEEYKLGSSIWWWIGGLALIGGGVAIALSSHGGGKKNNSSENKEAYNSLGSHSATKGTVVQQTGGVATNSQNLNRTSTNTQNISAINLLSNVLSNTEYMDVILKAANGASYTNAENTVLQVGNGVIGIDATKSSSGVNNGYISVASPNASVGIVASENSSGINQGRGVVSGTSTNGIDLNFTGYNATTSIIGMYADTASTIENQGDIRGSAVKASAAPEGNNGSSSTSIVDIGTGGLVSNFGTSSNSNSESTPASGTLVGMEAMILNMGNNLNTQTVTVKNNANGQIYLSASNVSTETTAVYASLIGMGSYLDTGFVDGSLNINRTENASLINSGTINLRYSGVYTPTTNTALESGLGGIVGMRADANTQALNNGNIYIYLNDSGTNSGVNVAAGMQSVHGGNLNNSGNIYLSASADNNRVNYGMLAVKGLGKLADSLSSNQQLISSGKINLEASNSYGMASFNGGVLKNTGTIRLGKEVAEGQTNAYKNNIALYGYGSNFESNLQNTGTIDIYSYQSMAMQNDYSGATKLENRGTINVYNSARDTHVFGGAYSELHNYGDITYSATPTGAVITAFATGTDVFKSYTPSCIIAVMNTKAQTLTETSATTTSNTEQIFNNNGASITIKEASGVTAMAVETDEGKAYNRGTITISTSENENSTGTIGMYLADSTDSNALLSNEGDILTNSLGSAAMVSNSTKNAALINASGARIKTDFQNSLGMASFGVSTMQNAGSIQINGRNSMGVYARGASTIQNLSGGVINVGSASAPVINGYGIYLDTSSGSLTTVPEIMNRGEINVWTSLAGGGIYTLGNETNIQNYSNINIYSDQAYGIYLSGAVNVVNNEGARITVGQSTTPVRNSYAIYAAAGGATTVDTLKIQNNGIIDFYNKESEVGYAIYSDLAGTITNNGQINLYNANSNGIFAKNSLVTNKSIMNINKNESAAIIADGSTDVVNDTIGVINVGTNTLGTVNSYGVSSTDTATGKITNNGIINLYSATDSYGVFAKGQVAVENNNIIQSYNDNSSAVYTVGTNTVTNNKTIIASGSNVYAIRGFDSASTLSAVNAKNASINVGSGYAIAGDKINTITNNGSITVSGSGSYGIYANSGTQITNGEDAGVISMNGGNSTAIRSGTVATVINAGDILLSGDESKGIDATSGTTLTNSGHITANGNASKAISGSGTITNVTNSGTISMENDDSTGIEANSGTTLTNDASGSITMKGKNSIAIDSNKVTTVNNKGTVLLKKSGSKGIHALSNNSVNVTNSKSITLENGLNAYGVWVESSSASVTNEKDATITIGSASSGATETNGYGVRVNSNRVYNYGTITLYTQGQAIHVDSAGTVQNGQAGTVGTQGFILTKAPQSHAVDMNGGTLNNYGQIMTEGNASRAVNLQSSSSVTNYLAGSILIKGTKIGTTKNYGIYSSGAATIVNNGTIAAVEDSDAYTQGAHLIYVDRGSSVTNNLYLTAGDNSVAIEGGFSSSVTANVNSRINVGDNSSAIIVGSNSTVATAGEINVGNGSETNHVYAIKAGNATQTLNNTATITVGTNGTALWIGANSKTVTSDGDDIVVGNGTEDDFSYGIYAESGDSLSLTNGADISVGDYGRGIYVKGAKSVTNNGAISVGKGTASHYAYGLYVGSADTVINTADISVKEYGQGIFAIAKTVTNSGHITINATESHSMPSLGINVYVPTNSTATTINNTGTITINDPTNTSKAIYVSKDYELDEKEGSTPEDPQYKADKVSYNADIDWGYVTVNCAQGGICIMPDSEEDKNAQRTSGPTYYYTDSASSYSLASYSPTSLFGFSPSALTASVRLVNTGRIETPSQDVDFGNEDSNETNVVGQGGSYTANSFTGTVYAAPSIVQGEFDTTYVNEDTFIGTDNGINVVSESYLFNAGKQTSSAGNTSVVMTMKPFNETTGFNTQMANYLQQNYAAGKGEGVFNTLKNAKNATQYQQFINNEFGFNMVPNLAKQSFDAEKIVGREITDDLFTPTDENQRMKVGAVAYAYDVDGKKDTVGYEENVEAVYGYYDESVAANTRAGLGVALTRADSDYDGGGSRYNNMFEVYMPVIFNSDHLKALIKPKAGLAHGHYRRMGTQRAYKASTKDYFYGFDTEARQAYDLGMVEIEPNVGFNLTGLYMDDVKEKDDGMKIKSKNVISAQSFVGADVKKKFEIDTHQAVAAIVGGKYYHEFGQKYRAKATMADMNGYYDIISDRLKRNFGLLSAKAQYNYDKFSVSASVNAPVAQDENVYYLFNMGYQF